MFSLAALASALGLLVVSERARPKPLLLGLGALVAAILPWRSMWPRRVCTRRTTSSRTVSTSYLADASGRLRPAATELLDQIAQTDNWGLLGPLAACGSCGTIATPLLGAELLVPSLEGELVSRRPTD